MLTEFSCEKTVSQFVLLLGVDRKKKKSKDQKSVTILRLNTNRISFMSHRAYSFIAIDGKEQCPYKESLMLKGQSKKVCLFLKLSFHFLGNVSSSSCLFIYDLNRQKLVLSQYGLKPSTV